MFSNLTILSLLMLAALSPLARGQTSFDEAERRLREKLATRPSTTRPVTEIDQLRAENRRLRERVDSLEKEIVTLKTILAHASSPTTGPTTRPSDSTPLDALLKLLVGHWRGGDIIAGTGYIIEFDDAGTYKQVFVATYKKTTGQFRLNDDKTMEMWSDNWPDDKRHNLYLVNITPAIVTLTPRVFDGVDVKNPRDVMLRRAE